MLVRTFGLLVLLGNHEETMLVARKRPSNLDFWLSPVCGGLTTLESYGPAQDFSLIPAQHFRFLEGLRRYHETDMHYTGKTAIVGHTPQPDGIILDLGYLKGTGPVVPRPYVRRPASITRGLKQPAHVGTAEHPAATHGRRMNGCSG